MIKEEQYYGLKLFGRMSIWQQKEDGLEGKRLEAGSPGGYVNSQGECMEVHLILMKFLHVGQKMTQCGRLSSTVIHNAPIPPS